MIRKIFNWVGSGFFRGFGRILVYILIGLLLSYFVRKLDIKSIWNVLLAPIDTYAYENSSPFANLTISENGAFWNNSNSNGANSNIGYGLTADYFMYYTNQSNEIYYAKPTQSTTLGTYGYTLTQCGIPIQPNRNYAILYYFISGINVYIYPSYSSVTNKIGISNNNSSVSMNTYTNVWYADDNALYVNDLPGFEYLHSFAITFTPQVSGNCVSVAVSSRTSQSSNDYKFIGYKLYDFGTAPITTTEIQNALQSNFNTINNNINGMSNSINQQTQQQQQNHQETIETLTDDDTDESLDEASDFFSNFSTNTHGLTGIITAPLSAIQSLSSSTCTPLTLPLPFVNKDLTLPCMRQIYDQHFGTFMQIYDVITLGIVAYWVCVRIFSLVKDFKNPEHDEIEVVDL